MSLPHIATASTVPRPEPNESTEQRRPSPWTYTGTIVGFTVLLVIVVAFIHVHGTYMFPRGFDVLRRVFHGQYALLGGALLATVLWMLPGRGVVRAARWALLLLLYLSAAWFVIWVLVHRVFGIELTPSIVLDILINHAPISEMGVSAGQVATTVLVSFAAVFGMVAVTEMLTVRHGPKLRRRCFFVASAVFLLVHLPVRAYFVHYINLNDFAVSSYDDCVPFSLRSEHLLGGGHPRMTLPNLESRKRTEQYLAYIPEMTRATIPRPHNILWLNVESLRFDGITPLTTPHLWQRQEQFQLRLDRNHWSNANATHFAVFSMLTGLGGYQLPAFVRAGQTDPFVLLLQNNLYAVRFWKKAHVESADLLPLIPAATLCTDVDMKRQRGDPSMVDRYLHSRAPNRQPRFDFLPFDETHWPYSFQPKDEILRPAPELNTSGIVQGWMHFARSEDEMNVVHNRYGNACHAVDEQIGRVLDDLEARGGFSDTIIIVTGDHGEEFQERGQLTHSAVLNDFQGRTVLWMHFPDRPVDPIPVKGPTMHIDIVPTIVDALGFKNDVLYTQGQSLLGPLKARPLLSLSEQGGVAVPQYRCLVSDDYISRWRYTPAEYQFSGVQRRDGGMVEGKDWEQQVRANYATSASMYELLPDVKQPGSSAEPDSAVTTAR